MNTTNQQAITSANIDDASRSIWNSITGDYTSKRQTLVRLNQALRAVCSADKPRAPRKANRQSNEQIIAKLINLPLGKINGASIVIKGMPFKLSHVFEHADNSSSPFQSFCKDFLQEQNISLKLVRNPGNRTSSYYIVRGQQ